MTIIRFKDKIFILVDHVLLRPKSFKSRPGGSLNKLLENASTMMATKVSGI